MNKNIFEASNILSVKLKNRFIRSATWENLATEDGHMTRDLFNVYKELAMGQVGGIITGYANIVEEEKPNPGMMGIYSDDFIEEYRQLTTMVHSHGSAIFMQLAYGGTKTKYNLGERTIFAPSQVAERSTGTIGSEMTKKDIKYIVNAFAKAALRAKLAGFDGIEIHGAHTYLINQFLSPYYNRREDEYGGCLENRMRFLIEIYEKTREYVGLNYPILIKLTATEFFDGGLTFEDTKKIAKTLEKIGVDAIELSGNIHSKGEAEVGNIYEGYMLHNEAYFIEFAESIAKHVKIPVITVGGIKSISKVEELFNKGSIEYFALSRPLLTEPDLIKRWQDGDRSDVKCTRCSMCRTPQGNYCTLFNK